ncbi:MAG: hypothetical protein B7X77_10905 [Caulobacter sp. 39-67-4]|nr:MAG: hypothetical protein B7X77_10905 [Caulobacter sp. 39-67-4]
MAEAFICDAIRTPIGRYAGALSSVRADDLAAITLKALAARNTGVDWSLVDDVVLALRSATHCPTRSPSATFAYLLPCIRPALSPG